MCVLGRVGGFAAGPCPHPPFGHLPPQAGEGSGWWSVAVQPTDAVEPTDHAQPGMASPAGGRGWRAAPDAGIPFAPVAPVVVASRRARPHPPFGHLPPAGGGREQVGVGCSATDRCGATDRSRAARHRFSRWREKVARSAG
ncbi:hypothetical protein XAP3CFBP6996_008245 [Xanthomonas citri pv. fuscans CFBP 6996]|nr:hypothetical protein XAP3CFBP6996_008245 [Xanthomonas citri pv. fuscans CFBP 6996]QWN15853.1 hypothetical protein DGN02_08315 [Xanthomonas citri]